jgi:creatinine amidohydrolase/Fe(II)-dependent formamide hydrolase-like protein
VAPGVALVDEAGVDPVFAGCWLHDTKSKKRAHVATRLSNLIGFTRILLIVKHLGKRPVLKRVYSEFETSEPWELSAALSTMVMRVWSAVAGTTVPK